MHGQEKILGRLREVLDQPDTMILIGSGVSLWSGLPSWTHLLNALADYLQKRGLTAEPVRKEIISGNLLLAASYAVHQIHKRELGTFLREVLRHSQATPSELHRLIVALGPTCFVTTNYDHLLETAIRQSYQKTEPRVVTNRQPIEIADIIPASARNFVFKYHGDLADVESIVLCREQYRQIKHDYPDTLRALSTLLATRPVLMIGFGLQDPDFLLVQDELVSIFQGQAGQYFAIQPDFDDLRISYWRQNYRTDVISYRTTTKGDGTPDHTQLITLIRELLSDKFRGKNGHQSPVTRLPSHRILLLARLAASILKQKPPSVNVSLPLSVDLEFKPKVGFRPFPSRLMDLLRHYEGSFLLLGQPGAGKSFALKNYAMELADVLTRQCLTDIDHASQTHIVLFVDLTLYRGDLKQTIAETFPTGLKLHDILIGDMCTVVLDSANEMPREYIEGEHWVNEFESLRRKFPRVRFIIGCRNEAWIKVIDLPTFVIKGIDLEFVKTQLSEVVPHEALVNPVLSYALSSPLLFSMVKSGEIAIEKVVTPSELYERYWRTANQRWREATGETVDFASALEPVAYSMLENGVEYAPKASVEGALAAALHQVDAPLAALLRDGALVALSGHRLTFRHQSLTEHLAARVIARRFLADPMFLDLLLKDKRWDQTLFLAAGIMRPKPSKEFIKQILRTDILAGARAAYYLGKAHESIINVILQASIELGKGDFEQRLNLAWVLRGLPYGLQNVRHLRTLAKKPDALGGFAAGALFSLLPESRSRIIIAVFEHHDDFNYMSHYIDDSWDHWELRDIRFFFRQLSEPKHLMTDGLHPYEKLIAKVPVNELPLFCSEFLETSSACRWVIAGGLCELDNSFATTLLKNLVRNGEQNAFYLLYSHLRFKRSPFPAEELPPDDTIIKSILKELSGEDAPWAAGAGQQLVERNKEWAAAFRQLATEETAVRQIIVEVMVSEKESRERPIREALGRISELNPHEISAIAHDDFWETASPDILAQALETREPRLVGGLHIYLRSWDEHLPILRNHDLYWWLDWIEECCRGPYGREEGAVHVLREALLKSNKETREKLIERFNEGRSKDFWRIGGCVFYGSKAVSTDEFSADAKQVLLAEADRRPWIGRLLGDAATEHFVISELLPLMGQRDRSPWILEALKIAGARHNRRYTV